MSNIRLAWHIIFFGRNRIKKNKWIRQQKNFKIQNMFPHPFLFGAATLKSIQKNMVVVGRLWIISRIMRIYRPFYTSNEYEKNIQSKKKHKQTKKKKWIEFRIGPNFIKHNFVCVRVYVDKYCYFYYLFFVGYSNNEGRKRWAFRILRTKLYWLWWFFLSIK